ncbi:MAG TPA: SPFH domain-containing protein [Candidatus Paceibacterota bacterium]
MDSVLMALLSAIAAGITAVFKTIKFVHEGERGIRLRFGKARRDYNGNPVVYDPGFLLLIPFVDTLQRRHVRQQTLKFENQLIMLKSGLIFNVSAIVMFRVTDVYKALFEIDQLDDSISDLSMGILRDEISKRGYEDLFDTEGISTNLFSALQGKAEEWGVEFVMFKLTNCAPTPSTANIVNVQIGTKMKAAALIEGAKQLDLDVSRLNSTLGAVLVGMPLVATAWSEKYPTKEPAKTKEEVPLTLKFGGKKDED